MPVPVARSPVAENLARVRDRVAAACARAGRSPDGVTIVGVTKYADLDAVRGLVAAGVRDLGEARPQQLVERAELLADLGPPRWHLIGHLQRNKVRRVLGRCERVHSIDSVRLLEACDRIAEDEALDPPRVLLEVRLSPEISVGGEAAKDGFDPDGLRRAWPAIAALPHLRVTGLMTMAPHAADPQRSRPVFAALRDLRDELGGPARLPELSMGMSGDLEVAVEEGATWVRPGSALFGG